MLDEIRAGRHFDQLRKRRDQILMTLRHISKEQEQVEQNTDWLNQAACQSRVNLLNRLNDWYTEEMDKIDKALNRIRLSQYGLCLGCHHPIGADRLDISPEAEFCGSCQDVSEQLEAR
jgi:RNA polymerase-binding transcription factor DksA